MADWAKIKFYWKSILGSQGSSLEASSTFERTSVSNISNMLETNLWQAAGSQGPHYITLDSGVGNTQEADYLAVSGHNLASANAQVSLQYSTDGESYTNAFTPFTPASDMAFVKEFASPGAFRYWRLALEGTDIAPFIYIGAWGLRTELDYASASFDPNEQEVKAAVNLSNGGYLAGAHAKYIERSMTIRFDDADAALYGKVREWWEGSGSRNFFVAWEHSGHPEDVFLMRPEPRFSNPLKAGGAARDITIALTGRKE
jgi:hypothetical protein